MNKINILKLNILAVLLAVPASSYLLAGDNNDNIKRYESPISRASTSPVNSTPISKDRSSVRASSRLKKRTSENISVAFDRERNDQFSPGFYYVCCPANNVEIFVNELINKNVNMLALTKESAAFAYGSFLLKMLNEKANEAGKDCTSFVVDLLIQDQKIQRNQKVPRDIVNRSVNSIIPIFEEMYDGIIAPYLKENPPYKVLNS